MCQDRNGQDHNEARYGPDRYGHDNFTYFLNFLYEAMHSWCST